MTRRVETGKRVWVVEMWLDLPRKQSHWIPTVGVGLDRDQGRVKMDEWRKRNPEDRFRLVKYWGTP